MSKARDFHDGRQDGLVALESLDLDRVTSFAGLLRAMSRTAFSGRSLARPSRSRWPWCATPSARSSSRSRAP